MSKDRCIGIFFFLLFALLWFWVIPANTRGPVEAAYPRFAAILMLVPAIGLMLRRTTPENALRLPAFDMQRLLQSEYMRILLLVMSYPIYLICVQALGFYTAGFLFCIGWMLFFGERTFARVLITPVVLLGSIYCIVSVFLRYPLPRGLFI